MDSQVSIPKKKITTGVSNLKFSPWAAYIMNTIFLADILKGTVGWSKSKGDDDFKKNVKNFKNLQGNIRKSLTRRGQVALDIDEDALGILVHSVVYSFESPVALGRVGKGTNMYVLPSINENSPNAPKISGQELYNEVSHWFTPGSVVPKPILDEELKQIFSLTDLYLITAIKEAKEQINRVNKTLNVVENLKNANNDVVPRLTLHPIVVESNLREFLDRAIKSKGVTAQNETAVSACNAAIRIATEMRPTILDSGYASYEQAILPGAHIAYQFSNGALHHAIYLGSNVVIEVANYDTGNADKSVKGFITMTHLYDFIKRARNSPSELLTFEYENPYPLEVIKKRALWALGRYPRYNIVSENCESFANWVLTNEFEARMCIIMPTTIIRSTAARDKIINSLSVKDLPDISTEALREEAINSITENNSNSKEKIGGRRKTRKNSKS